MLDDDGKLRKKYNNKKINAAKHDILFTLTYPEFRKLVKQAGLVSSQLGFSGENYVLARYRDRGAYSVGNCRFITQAENMRERVWTENSRQKRLTTLKERSGSDPISETLQTCQTCRKDFYSNRLRQFCSVVCKNIGLKDGRSARMQIRVSNTLINKIKKLRASGLSGLAISNRVGVSRNTVMKYW